MICCRCDQRIPKNSRANQWFCKHCFTAVKKFDKWNKEIEKKARKDDHIIIQEVK